MPPNAMQRDVMHALTILVLAMQVARQRDKAEEKLQLLHGRLDDAKRGGRKALAERTAENWILTTELSETRRAEREAELALSIATTAVSRPITAWAPPKVMFVSVQPAGGSCC